MEQRKKIKKKYIITAIVSFIVMALILTNYLFTWGANYFVFNVSPPAYTVIKVSNLEKTGGSIELTDGDINGLIGYIVKKGISKNGVKVDKIYSKINEDKLEFYCPAKVKFLKLMLYCSGDISYEKDKVKFVPLEFRIGKIKLSKSFVMNKLKNLSREGMEFTKDYITISSELIPFDFNGLNIKDNKLFADIKKVEIPVLTGKTTTGKTTSGGSTGGKTVNKEDLLKKTSRQLSGVYAAVKSQKEKEIVSRIQSTINKMIANPSYQYQKDVEAVKAMKSKLTQSEKEDLQNAILDNMDTRTIKQMRATFGV